MSNTFSKSWDDLNAKVIEWNPDHYIASIILAVILGSKEGDEMTVSEAENFLSPKFNETDIGDEAMMVHNLLFK